MIVEYTEHVFTKSNRIHYKKVRKLLSINNLFNNRLVLTGH